MNKDNSMQLKTTNSWQNIQYYSFFIATHSIRIARIKDFCGIICRVMGIKSEIMAIRSGIIGSEVRAN